MRAADGNRLNLTRSVVAREDRPRDPQADAAISSERIKIALWLRQEFADEPRTEVELLTQDAP